MPGNTPTEPTHAELAPSGMTSSYNANANWKAGVQAVKPDRFLLIPQSWSSQKRHVKRQRRLWGAAHTLACQHTLACSEEAEQILIQISGTVGKRYADDSTFKAEEKIQGALLLC